ncbi:SpvB/TcaC N-terminal domain-containing protein [Chryseobacterium daecheongense]|nr:SpvB/TcaC N-terminal domain-containing protein [Chryseobacterium daecheongense]
MKILSSLVLSLCSVLGYSQTILYQQESTSRTVQDPQTVVLAQGFKASSGTSNPFVAKIGPSTENPGGGPTDSGAGAGNPTGTSAPTGQSFHDTKGNIEVSGTGQLQFSLPIALPPGIKSVAPQINLTYTSGSVNGIAGYGWDISGITAVSRISKNIEKDGITKSVQLDYSDNYSFNGQRLILKSGEYGKDGAEYVTEKYSNIKIKSLGTKNGVQGPMLFHVTFDDGSQAWYGDTEYSDPEHYSAARTSMGYNLVKWMDAQGNYITYEYEKNQYLTSQPVPGGDVTRIKKIKWGGNETLNKPHFNEISFNYNLDRTFKEISYHQGFYYNQDKLLNEVVVSTNGNQFRRYALEYTDNGTSYQFVNKITEYNSNNEAANPIAIEYEPAQTAGEETTKEYNITTTNTKKYGDFDMDGITDYLEYVPTPGTAGSTQVGVLNFKSSVYKDVPVMPLQYELNRFTAAEFGKAASVTFKKDGYVKNKAGIVIPHTVATGDPKKPNYELLVYSVDISDFRFKLEYSKLITYDQYAIGDPGDDDLPMTGCNYSVVSLSELTSYDYDGDGITELLFNFRRTRTCINGGFDPEPIGKTISNPVALDETTPPTLPYIEPSVNSSNTEEYGVPPIDNGEVNIIPGSTLTSFYSSILFDLSENLPVAESIYKYDEGTGAAKKIQFADFNGDGIQDIIWLNSSNGTMTKVFNINKISAGNFVLSNVGNFTGQALGGFFNGALYGDFNGDSKIDVLVPQGNKSYNWNLFLSDGKKLNQFYINNFIFYSSGTETLTQGVHNTFFESGCAYGMSRYFQYNTADLDGDGKSEIIVSNVLITDHTWNAHHDKEWTNTNVTVYSVNKVSGANDKSIVYNPPITILGASIPQPYNTENTVSIQTNSGINFYKTRNWLKSFNEKVIPFSNLTINKDNQQVILLGKPDDCSGVIGCGYNYVIQYGYPYVPALARAKNIKQGGITTEISYKELNSKTDANFYQPVQKELYPYFELEQAPLSAAVSQIKQYTPAGTLIQDFRYRGFLSHFTGRGVIGFRQTARSSLYAAGFENAKIWSGIQIDPLLDGVPVKEWSIRTNNENLIFPADISENNTQLLNYKSTIYKTDKLLNGQVVTTVSDADKPKVVTATVATSTLAKDFLTNVTTAGTAIYNTYYLPSKTTSNVNDNFSVTTTDFIYTHNPSGIGKDYFIGHLDAKTMQHAAYNTTNKVSQYYLYQNNLPKTVINVSGNNFSNNFSDNLTEDYKYDGFGNVIEKKVTAGSDSQFRINKSEYDDKGRFVIKKTDNLGLETSITYNNWGQILSETDPSGNTTTNTYDFWGKQLTAKTNIGGTTSYQYIKDDQGNTMVITYEADGSISRKYNNKLGQEYKTQTKGFEQGKFVAVYRMFDALGRKIKESEPYFDQATEDLPANIQWNTFTYDDSVFPAKMTASFFNGKQTESWVSGTVTTLKELNGYGRTTTKTVDALGNVISTTDKGGTINFTYNSLGKQLTAQYGSNVVTTKYDVWGRKTEHIDPSNGKYTYEYDGFDQVKKIISPKGTKEYIYNTVGQLITQKEISTVDAGAATNKLISFVYDNKGRVISKTGTSKGKAYSSSQVYDQQGRLLSASENSNGRYYMQKGVTYDDKGRVISYEKSLYSSGVLTKIDIENVYSTWNGELSQVKDKTSGKILWTLMQANAKGQVLKAKLGASEVNNVYDPNGFLASVNHSSQVKPGILQLSYSFDAIKNELKSRTTGGDFNIVESFDYDDNNRLINWTNPVTGIKPSSNRNVYDEKGRILENDQVGTIKFNNSAKIYQPTGMTLNAAGTQNYNNDLIQSIVYNENNDPVFIDGQKGDVAFQYGLTSMRQRVTYGGNFAADGDGKFTKFYSGDGSFEVVLDNTTGKEKHVLYIGGTPYESNIIFLKDYNETNGSYKFLHKDYIGSILAISDEAGNKLEQRHFDAWGNFTHLQVGNGAIITDKNIIDNTALLIERGYTSHEHFAEIGIIHMNGRLYDPLLRRFLNADENIQEPYNTQNYNKYGYVMNNPLLFNDPSGEYIFGIESALLAAVVIGAIVGAASYIVSAIITGQKFSLLGLFKSTVFGAISGAVTFGIGQLFAPAIQSAVQVSNTALKVMAQTGVALAQATVHGIAQGTLSLMQGGSFHQAMLSGALGSLGASAFGAFAKDFANQTVGKVLFGAISGGVGAELSGGNFWQGAVIGGIVAGLNHAMEHLQKTYEVSVLHDYGGANGAGHEAIAFENPDGTLLYISKDGTHENGGVYGETLKTDQNFKSIEEINDFYSTKVSPGKRYDAVAVYRATRAQINRGIAAARNVISTKYKLLTSSCTTVVEQSLKAMYNARIYSGMMAPNINFFINNFIFDKHLVKFYDIK